MLPSRLVPSGQQSAMRKSRLEHQRPSMLPKPRRPGSTDRLSTEARRPSAAGHRSSSAEPARGTFGGARLSREASATKISLSGRSRSQQGDRFGQTYMTPLRTNQFSRPTTTPVRTPSEDRASRSWQTALERALAFVTVKDQRPISSVVWQRAEVSRVGSALSARGEGGGMALLRPLTIARFVDIVAALLVAFTRDANKINTDNYVTKLPHLAKKLLYPGTLSKSWLKTVNTLHAFPQALALIGYLLDLVNHIEKEVSDEWLYIGKDELACFRREYLYKCWIRFQDPDHQFEDLNEEHLHNVRQLLGDDEEKIAELLQVIKKYKACLNDEEYISGRADEARRVDRREALLSSLKAERALIHAARVDSEEQRNLQKDQLQDIKQLDLDIERATAENQQLKLELESQPLSVEQRTKLLDEAEYALRVQDSKRTLALQIAKMVMSRETELAVWQKKTLDSCMHYNQGLIHLSAQFPDLTALAIDEKELMSPECSARVCAALDSLRARGAALAAQRSEHAREKSALARKRTALLEETRTKISELKSSVHREQESLESESSKESVEAAGVAAELRAVSDRLHELNGQLEEYARLDSQLHFWEHQDLLWRTNLETLQEYINNKRTDTQRLLEAARLKRAQHVIDCVRHWNEKLAG